MRRPIARLTLLLAAAGASAPTSALPFEMTYIDADTPRRVEAPFAFPPPASAPAPGEGKPQNVPVATAERAPGGNPLWAIPLASLSTTRERPLFSSTRRPPPPAVVPLPEVKAPPPESSPAERPQLSLVGTVASSDRSFGIFLDQATRSALRLKAGEDFQGWKLLSVLGREATFERDRQTTILRLPQPDADADGQVRVQAGTAATGYLDFQPQRGGLR